MELDALVGIIIYLLLNLTRTDLSIMQLNIYSCWQPIFSQNSPYIVSFLKNNFSTMLVSSCFILGIMGFNLQFDLLMNILDMLSKFINFTLPSLKLGIGLGQ